MVDRDETMTNDRIKTYVRGLDEKMEGGIPSNHIVLLSGRAGTMKSSIAFSLLYNQAKHEGKRGIYLTLEQSRNSLIEHMIRLGFDPQEIKGSGGIIVLDLARLRKEMETDGKEGEINWPQSIVTTVNNYKMKFGCNIFVLDSLAALYSISTFENPRSDIFMFFDKLRELNITTFLVSEMFEPEKLSFGMYNVEEFLADGIVHLEMERDKRNVNLFLGVVKMRKTGHDRAYYPLLVTKSNFEIVTQ
jgi:KaiC/GvpD/RAD55 family RecA-like ATPase